mmetsp:Transcript_9513/g.19000  ORF Transcript_9513/g.19000 Transcript_9513/m.19000 type:complete len:234 (-) Transcript_9513:26-727(-)
MASLNAGGSATGNIVYCAVVRFGDRAVVAANAHLNSGFDPEAVHKLYNQPNLMIEPGRRYRVPTENLNFYFVSDDQDRIFLVVTRENYPDRVAFKMIEELRTGFLQKYADKSLVCKEHALDRAASKLMQRLCDKYDDLQQVDSIASVEAKVDVVKVVMQDNISKMLENSAKLDDIYKTAEELQQQAGVFKKNATKLRKRMWWKNKKMCLALTFLIAAVMTIIVTYLVCTNSEC